MKAADRKAYNEGLVQWKTPYPVIWCCQRCDKSARGPDGVKTLQDNIGDDDEFVLEDDEEVGLCFAYHVRCLAIDEVRDDLRTHIENGGWLN